MNNINRVSDFQSQLKVANKDELFVTELLNKNDINTTYSWVGDEEKYWHYGDIKAEDGDSQYFIDVKSDDCICRTHNFLAEHKVMYRKGMKWTDGFMTSHYDFVFVLSKAEHKIYVLDFAKWQQKYQKWYKKHLIIPHNDKNGVFLQKSDAYLMSIDMAKDLRVLIGEITYTDDFELDITYKTSRFDDVFAYLY